MVLVLTTGSALAIDWAQQNVPAILVAWYPGQRGGNAVADVLFGDVNPAGRLPVTFYRGDEQLPAFDDYSMRGRTYRYFTGRPLYPFGYGLSYTRFQYSDLRLDRGTVATDGEMRASVKVKNVGSRAGDEVVQLYVRQPGTVYPRPIRALRGFDRISLAAGESKQVEFIVKPERDVTRYDDAKKAYIVDPGKYEVEVGASSADIRQHAVFTVN